MLLDNVLHVLYVILVLCCLRNEPSNFSVSLAVIQIAYFELCMRRIRP